MLLGKYLYDIINQSLNIYSTLILLYFYNLVTYEFILIWFLLKQKKTEIVILLIVVSFRLCATCVSVRF